MAAVSLTDQMGAMALIDEMRHKQLIVQEHLDLPVLREKVVGRIREYYQSQNIAVDDATVEEGVRAYFDKRLTFEAPASGKLASLIANAYITRATWKQPAIIAAVALGLAGTGTTMALQGQERSRVAQVETSAADATATRDNLRNQLAQHRAKMEAWKQRLAQQPLAAAERILAALPEPLAQAEQLLTVKPPSGITSQTREVASTVVAKMKTTLHEAEVVLRGVDTRLSDVQGIFGAHERYQGVVTTSGYPAARARYPVIAEAEHAVRNALDDADTQGIVQLNAAVVRLAALAGDSLAIEDLGEQIRNTVASLKALKMGAADAQRVATLASGAEAAVRELDAAQAREGLQQLKQTLAYAKMPLEIRIVDRSGVKSGVERNYNQSGGKSWYLIAEAVDASGRVVAIPVTSIETGKTQQAKVFGVRVEKPHFDKVRADKADDGHVDDKVFGQKPANSLTINFPRAFSAKPDMILEW